jgi:chromosome segregation ATPase
MPLPIDYLNPTSEQLEQIERLRSLIRAANSAVTELRGHLEELVSDLESAEWGDSGVEEDTPEGDAQFHQRDAYLWEIKELLDNIEQTESLLDTAIIDFC